jgi:predicted transcriptional regulator
MVRRDRIEIIMSILGVCEGTEVNKTRIFYSTNLNFKLGQEYLDLLKKRGLMMEAGGRYRTTEKGSSFLNAGRRIQALLGSESLMDLHSEPSCARIEA